MQHGGVVAQSLVERGTHRLAARKTDGMSAAARDELVAQRTHCGSLRLHRLTALANGLADRREIAYMDLHVSPFMRAALPAK